MIVCAAFQDLLVVKIIGGGSRTGAYGSSTSYEVTRQVLSSVRQSRRRTGASPLCVRNRNVMPKALPVLERQGIGRHRATGSSFALDGIAKRSREAGETEHPRVRLIHDTNRRVERLGRLDDRVQIALRPNPLADAFETCADLPPGIVEGC